MLRFFEFKFMVFRLTSFLLNLSETMSKLNLILLMFAWSSNRLFSVVKLKLFYSYSLRDIDKIVIHSCSYYSRIFMSLPFSDENILLEFDSLLLK